MATLDQALLIQKLRDIENNKTQENISRSLELSQQKNIDDEYEEATSKDNGTYSLLDNIERAERENETRKRVAQIQYDNSRHDLKVERDYAWQNRLEREHGNTRKLVAAKNWNDFVDSGRGIEYNVNGPTKVPEKVKVKDTPLDFQNRRIDLQTDKNILDNEYQKSLIMLDRNKRDNDTIRYLQHQDTMLNMLEPYGKSIDRTIEMAQKQAIAQAEAYKASLDDTVRLFRNAYDLMTIHEKDYSLEITSGWEGIGAGLIQGGAHFVDSTLTAIRALGSLMFGDGQAEPVHWLQHALINGGFNYEHIGRLTSDMFSLDDRITTGYLGYGLAESAAEMGLIGWNVGHLSRAFRPVNSTAIKNMIVDKMAKDARALTALGKRTGKASDIVMAERVKKAIAAIENGALENMAIPDLHKKMAEILGGKLAQKAALDRYKKLNVSKYAGKNADELGKMFTGKKVFQPLHGIIGGAGFITDYFRRVTDLASSRPEGQRDIKMADYLAALPHIAVDYASMIGIMQGFNKSNILQPLWKQADEGLEAATKTSFKQRAASLVGGVAASSYMEGLGEMVQTYMELQARNNYTLPDMGLIMTDPKYQKEAEQIKEAGLLAMGGAAMLATPAQIAGQARDAYMENKIDKINKQLKDQDDKLRKQQQLNPNLASQRYQQNMQSYADQINASERVPDEVKYRYKNETLRKQQEELDSKRSRMRNNSAAKKVFTDKNGQFNESQIDQADKEHKEQAIAQAEKLKLEKEAIKSDIKNVKKAIEEAEAAGKDTTALKAKLADLQNKKNANTKETNDIMELIEDIDDFNSLKSISLYRQALAKLESKLYSGKEFNPDDFDGKTQKQVEDKITNILRAIKNVEKELRALKKGRKAWKEAYAKNPKTAGKRYDYTYSNPFPKKDPKTGKRAEIGVVERRNKIAKELKKIRMDLANLVKSDIQIATQKGFVEWLRQEDGTPFAHQAKQDPKQRTSTEQTRKQDMQDKQNKPLDGNKASGGQTSQNQQSSQPNQTQSQQQSETKQLEQQYLRQDKNSAMALFSQIGERSPEMQEQILWLMYNEEEFNENSSFWETFQVFDERILRPDLTNRDLKSQTQVSEDEMRHDTPKSEHPLRWMDDKLAHMVILPRKFKYIDAKGEAKELDLGANTAARAKFLEGHMNIYQKIMRMNVDFNRSIRELNRIFREIKRNDGQISQENEIKLKEMLGLTAESFNTILQETYDHLLFFDWLTRNSSSKELNNALGRVNEQLRNAMTEGQNSLQSMVQVYNDIVTNSSTKMKKISEEEVTQLITDTRLDLLAERINGTMFSGLISGFGEIINKIRKGELSLDSFISLAECIAETGKKMLEIYKNPLWERVFRLMENVDNNLNHKIFSGIYRYDPSIFFNPNLNQEYNILSIDSKMFKMREAIIRSIVSDLDVNRNVINGILKDILMKLWSDKVKFDKHTYIPLLNMFSDVTIFTYPFIDNKGTWDTTQPMMKIKVSELFMPSRELINKLFGKAQLAQIQQDQTLYDGVEYTDKFMNEFLKPEILRTILNDPTNEVFLSKGYDQTYSKHAIWIEAAVVGILEHINSSTTDNLPPEVISQLEEGGKAINKRSINAFLQGYLLELFGLIDDRAPSSQYQKQVMAELSIRLTNIVTTMFMERISIKGNRVLTTFEGEGANEYLKVNEKAAKQISKIFSKRLNELKNNLKSMDFLNDITSSLETVKEWNKKVDEDFEKGYLTEQQRDSLKKDNSTKHFINKEEFKRTFIEETFEGIANNVEELEELFNKVLKIFGKTPLNSSQVLNVIDFNEKIMREFKENANLRRDVINNPDRAQGMENPVNWIPIKIYQKNPDSNIKQAGTYTVYYFYMPPETGLNWSNPRYREALAVMREDLLLSPNQVEAKLSDIFAKQAQISTSFQMYLSNTKNENSRFYTGPVFGRAGIDFSKGVYYNFYKMPNNRSMTRNTAFSWYNNKVLRYFWRLDNEPQLSQMYAKYIKDGRFDETDKEARRLKNSIQEIFNISIGLDKNNFNIDIILKAKKALKDELANELKEEIQEAEKQLGRKLSWQEKLNIEYKYQKGQAKYNEISNRIIIPYYRQIYKNTINLNDFELLNSDGTKKLRGDGTSFNLYDNFWEKIAESGFESSYAERYVKRNGEDAGEVDLIALLDGIIRKDPTAFYIYKRMAKFLKRTKNILDAEAVFGSLMYNHIEDYFNGKLKLEEMMGKMYGFVDGSATASFENSLHINYNNWLGMLIMSRIGVKMDGTIGLPDGTFQHINIIDNLATMVLAQQQAARKLAEVIGKGDQAEIEKAYKALTKKPDVYQLISVLFNETMKPFAMMNMDGRIISPMMKFVIVAGLIDRNGAKSIYTPLGYGSSILNLLNAEDLTDPDSKGNKSYFGLILEAISKNHLKFIERFEAHIKSQGEQEFMLVDFEKEILNFMEDELQKTTELYQIMDADEVLKYHEAIRYMQYNMHHDSSFKASVLKIFKTEGTTGKILINNTTNIIENFVGYASTLENHLRNETQFANEVATQFDISEQPALMERLILSDSINDKRNIVSAYRGDLQIARRLRKYNILTRDLIEILKRAGINNIRDIFEESALIEGVSKWQLKKEIEDQIKIVIEEREKEFGKGKEISKLKDDIYEAYRVAFNSKQFSENQDFTNSTNLIWITSLFSKAAIYDVIGPVGIVTDANEMAAKSYDAVKIVGLKAALMGLEEVLEKIIHRYDKRLSKSDPHHISVFDQYFKGKSIIEVLQDNGEGSVYQQLSRNHPQLIHEIFGSAETGIARYMTDVFDNIMYKMGIMIYHDMKTGTTIRLNPAIQYNMNDKAAFVERIRATRGRLIDILRQQTLIADDTDSASKITTTFSVVNTFFSNVLPLFNHTIEASVVYGTNIANGINLIGSVFDELIATPDSLQLAKRSWNQLFNMYQSATTNQSGILLSLENSAVNIIGNVVEDWGKPREKDPITGIKAPVYDPEKAKDFKSRWENRRESDIELKKEIIAYIKWALYNRLATGNPMHTFGWNMIERIASFEDMEFDDQANIGEIEHWHALSEQKMKELMQFVFSLSPREIQQYFSGKYWYTGSNIQMEDLFKVILNEIRNSGKITNQNVLNILNYMFVENKAITQDMARILQKHQKEIIKAITEDMAKALQQKLSKDIQNNFMNNFDSQKNTALESRLSNIGVMAMLKNMISEVFNFEWISYVDQKREVGPINRFIKKFNTLMQNLFLLKYALTEKDFISKWTHRIIDINSLPETNFMNIKIKFEDIPMEDLHLYFYYENGQALFYDREGKSTAIDPTNLPELTVRDLIRNRLKKKEKEITDKYIIDTYLKDHPDFQGVTVLTREKLFSSQLEQTNNIVKAKKVFDQINGKTGRAYVSPEDGGHYLSFGKISLPDSMGVMSEIDITIELEKDSFANVEEIFREILNKSYINNNKTGFNTIKNNLQSLYEMQLFYGGRGPSDIVFTFENEEEGYDIMGALGTWTVQGTDNSLKIGKNKIDEIIKGIINTNVPPPKRFEDFRDQHNQLKSAIINTALRTDFKKTAFPKQSSNSSTSSAPIAGNPASGGRNYGNDEFTEKDLEGAQQLSDSDFFDQTNKDISNLEERYSSNTAYLGFIGLARTLLGNLKKGVRFFRQQGANAITGGGIFIHDRNSRYSNSIVFWDGQADEKIRLHELFHAATWWAQNSNNPKAHIILRQMDYIREKVMEALDNDPVAVVRIFGSRDKFDAYFRPIASKKIAEADENGIIHYKDLERVDSAIDIQSARSEFIALMALKPELVEYMDGLNIDTNDRIIFARNEELKGQNLIGKAFTYMRYLISELSRLFFEGFSNGNRPSEQMLNLINDLSELNNTNIEEKRQQWEIVFDKGLKAMSFGLFGKVEDLDEKTRNDIEDEFKKDLAQLATEKTNVIAKAMQIGKTVKNITNSEIAAGIVNIIAINTMLFFDKNQLNFYKRQLYRKAIFDLKDSMLDGTWEDKLRTWGINFSNYKGDAAGKTFVQKMKGIVEDVHAMNQVFNMEREAEGISTAEHIRSIIASKNNLMAALTDEEKEQLKYDLNAIIFNQQIGDYSSKQVVARQDLDTITNYILNPSLDNRARLEEWRNGLRNQSSQLLDSYNLTPEQKEKMADWIKNEAKQLAVTRLTRYRNGIGIQNSEEILRHGFRFIGRPELQASEALIDKIHGLVTLEAVFLGNYGNNNMLRYTQKKIKRIQDIAKKSQEVKKELQQLLGDLAEMQHLERVKGSYIRRADYQKARNYEKRMGKKFTEREAKHYSFGEHDKFKYGKWDAWYMDNHVPYKWNDDIDVKVLHKYDINNEESKKEFDEAHQYLLDLGYQIFDENQERIIMTRDQKMVRIKDTKKVYGHQQYSNKPSGITSGKREKILEKYISSFREEVDYSTWQNDLEFDKVLSNHHNQTKFISEDLHDAHMNYFNESFMDVTQDSTKYLAGSKHIKRHTASQELYEKLVGQTSIDEIFGNSAKNRYINNNISRANSIVWDAVLEMDSDIKKRITGASGEKYHHAVKIGNIADSKVVRSKELLNTSEGKIIVFDKQFMEDNNVFLTKFDGYDLLKTMEIKGVKTDIGTEIWVDKRAIPMLFGYNIMGLSSMEKIKEDPKMYRWIRGAETWLRKAIKETRGTEVIRKPQLVLKNYMQNMISLWGLGVPFIKTIQGMNVYHEELEKYHKLYAMKVKLESEYNVLLSQNETNNEAVQKRKNIQKALEYVRGQLAVNKMTPLVQSGMYSNIIDDADTNDDLYLEVASILKDVLKVKDINVKKNIGYGVTVEDVLNEAFLTNKSKIYKSFGDWTRYGDIVARAILYYHRLDQGYSQNEAESEVRNVYINYASPLWSDVGRAMDYYGTTYYMKFHSNIFPVIQNTISERPARALPLLAAFSMLQLGYYFTTFLSDNMYIGSLMGNLQTPLTTDPLGHLASLNRWRAFM